MTVQKAIDDLKHRYCNTVRGQCQWITEGFGTCDDCEIGVGIKSLEAWGHIKADIMQLRDTECCQNDSFDEYSEGRYDVACHCLRIIEHYFGKVEV